MSVLKKYQTIYDKSHNRRKKAFHDALERFRQVHSINEVKRQASYYTKLETWKDTIEKRKDRHDTEVRRQISVREYTFLSAEDKRAGTYQSEEQQNAELFVIAQGRRRKMFDSSIQKMQEDVKAEEVMRQERFIHWVLSVQCQLEDKTEHWKKEILDEELCGEQKFNVFILDY